MAKHITCVTDCNDNEYTFDGVFPWAVVEGRLVVYAEDEQNKLAEFAPLCWVAIFHEIEE